MRFALIIAAGMALFANSALAQKEKFDPFGQDVPLPEVLSEVLDPDGNGEIDDDEAKAAEQAFQKLPRTRQPIGQEIRKALDANGDRKIDADEARLGVARGKAHHKGASKEIAEIVKQLDTNGDQKISVPEFSGLIGKLGVLGPFLAPQLGQFFNRMDTNRNGEISLVEAQNGAELLVEQIEQARREERHKQLLQDPLYQQAVRAVGMLDKNRDQLVSKSEARKNKLVNDAFASADTNRDDQLSVDECHAYLRQQAAGKNADNQPKIEFLPREELKPAKQGPKRK
jgi:Ca2+-binding EF-hand superfamily protein